MAAEPGKGGQPSASVALVASVRNDNQFGCGDLDTLTGFAGAKLFEVLLLGFAMCKLYKRDRNETDWGRI